MATLALALARSTKYPPLAPPDNATASSKSDTAPASSPRFNLVASKQMARIECKSNRIEPSRRKRLRCELNG